MNTGARTTATSDGPPPVLDPPTLAPMGHPARVDEGSAPPTRTWAARAGSCVVEAQAVRGRFLQRLRRRMVSRWVLSYVAVAWGMLQLLDVLADIWSVPLPMQRTITLLLGLALPPFLVVAWYHGEKGRQRVCPLEAALVTLVTAGSVTVLWMI